MILTTTKPITDPRAITIDEAHPLWFEGTDMTMFRMAIKDPSDASKRALNEIYKLNRDGVCILSCQKTNVAIEVRRFIYSKVSDIMGAPVGGKAISQCSVSVEYLKGDTVEGKVQCNGLLIKEIQMFNGFVSTPELFLENLISKKHLDKSKFTENHYKWATGKPFRVKVYNIQPIDPNNTLPAEEVERISSIKIEYLYLPPNKTVCTTRTSSQSESLW
jgi:hypothetical protein